MIGNKLVKWKAWYWPYRPLPWVRYFDFCFHKPLVSGFIFLCLLLVGSATQAQSGEDQPNLKESKANRNQNHHPRTKTYMKRKWGVEVLFVRQTAAGYMLEFRYKVLDAKKAKSLFERQTKPVLIHPRTGAELVVPTPAKTGALRNSNPPLVDHTYWMFFANPGKLVKVGEIVNIKIGDFLAKDIVVQ